MFVERFGRDIFFFILIVLTAAAAQHYTWYGGHMVDANLWAVQAQLMHDVPGDISALDAYGHPGGTILEVTILTRIVSGWTYRGSLVVGMIIVNSLLIGCICLLAKRLRPTYWMWAGLIVVPLALNPLSDVSTPTSILAAILSVLLLFLTWKYAELRSASTIFLDVAWSVTAGALMATRADVGLPIIGFFVLTPLYVAGFKKVLQLGTMSLIAFILFDPFMWFFPVAHPIALLENMVGHYAKERINNVGSMEYLYSGFAQGAIVMFGVVASLIFAWIRRGREFMPLSVLYPTCAASVVTLLVVLSSKKFAVRYLDPIIFIWEVLTPLLLWEILVAASMTKKYPMLSRSLLCATVLFYPLAYVFF